MKRKFTFGRITTLITFFASIVMFAHSVMLHYIPDDAFISFRYSLNIARGYGPVFNIGEHVEGYTSPLWTFSLGLLHRLGLPIETTALTLSIACAIAAVFLLPLLSRQLDWSLLGLDALLLAANTSYAVWAGAGMEMTAFALVLVLASWFFLSGQKRWLGGVLFAVLALIRPEGILFGGVAVLFAIWPIWRREPGAWKNWVTFAACFAAPVLGHLVWRLSYYGYPLPNTFYDKVGFTLAQALRGAQYLGEAGWQYLLPLSIPLMVGLAQARDRKRAYIATGLLLYFCYIVFVGGDWMISFRLLTLVMPWIAVFAAAGLEKLGQWVSRLVPTRLLWASVVGAMLLALVLDLSGSLAVNPRQAYADDGKPIAEWLKVHCPKNLRLAVFANGALSWYAPDFYVVDMFGLTNTTIAHLSVPSIGSGPWAGHEKFNATIVLREKPDIFILQAALGDEPITTAEAWRNEPNGHLVEQFTDDIDFWITHSTQTAPMPDGKYFNFVILNPYPCK